MVLLQAYYLWFKALHLIAMVAWFAGMFYIFRLFVYHIKHRDEAAVASTLSVMEEKLLRIITRPAMIVTLLFGSLMLTANPSLLRRGWIHTKLLLVLCLVAYTLYAQWVQKKLADTTFPLTERACRFINEVPVLFLVAIVLLAVFKPF